MDDKKYDILRLENQFCFPLYAASRELVKRYHPFLKELNLTYTQYVVMSVFWEQKRCSMRELGELLHLDSGTLTPVLKSLDAKGLVRRYRSKDDERVVIVEATKVGDRLKEKAVQIPYLVGKKVVMDEEDAVTLHRLLCKLLDSMEDE